MSYQKPSYCQARQVYRANYSFTSAKSLLYPYFLNAEFTSCGLNMENSLHWDFQSHLQTANGGCFVQ